MLPIRPPNREDNFGEKQLQIYLHSSPLGESIQNHILLLHLKKFELIYNCNLGFY